MVGRRSWIGRATNANRHPHPAYHPGTPLCCSSTSCWGTTANLACTHAPTASTDATARAPGRAGGAEIDRAAARGFTEGLTGGEPTIRPDLPALVKHARRRGFAHVKVASNGLRYAHAPYLDHLRACGVDRFHVSMHARGDDAYEDTARRLATALLRRAAVAHREPGRPRARSGGRSHPQGGHLPRRARLDRRSPRARRAALRPSAGLAHRPERRQRRPAPAPRGTWRAPSGPPSTTRAAAATRW